MVSALSAAAAALNTSPPFNSSCGCSQLRIAISYRRIDSLLVESILGMELLHIHSRA